MDPPPPDWTVVLGVVAVPASPNANSLEVSDNGAGGSIPRLFAKTGLMIRAGATFSISVGSQHPGRAEIGWGSPGQPVGRLTATSCRGASASGSGWLALPGGYYVDEPTCLPIVVVDDHSGQSQQVHIGVGTNCPGQRAPSPLDAPHPSTG